MPDLIQLRDVTVIEQATVDELGPHSGNLAAVRAARRAARTLMNARIDERPNTYTVCIPLKDDKPP